MTTATFEQDGSAFHVCISGHSGFAAAGADIVCAACSTLGYTLMEQLTRMQRQRMLIALQAVVGDGCIDVQATAAEGSLLAVQAVFQTIICGYSLIERQYPSYVQLITTIK